MLITELLIYSFVGFLLTILIMPLNLKICHKLNLIDKPDERKVHKDLKYRGGGLTIYILFFFFMLFIYIKTQQIEMLGIIVASLLLFLVGLYDDKYDMPAKLKFILQSASATIVYLFGVQITKITIFGFDFYFNTWVSLIITVFWIVLLINAINIIDGLDGLASGITIIILFTLMIFTDDFYTKLICVFLIGSLFGFLKYNFFPSKIFLGDSGSMFLGFMIAVLSIFGLGKTVVGISTILVMCSFPLLDLCIAFARRFLQHKPIFSADKEHIHHNFLKRGFSHKSSVLMIYGINVICSGLAILTYVLAGSWVEVLIYIFFFMLIITLINYLYLFPRYKKHKFR